MSSKRARFTLLILLFAWLLAALPTSHAQDAAPTYQALVRFEDQYHLWDMATGDLTLLHGLADVEWTQSSWSPDGAYLLVSPYGENNCCSGLYDVERQMWDARIFESRAVWSPNGRYIAWSRHNDETSEIVLLDRESQEESVIYSIDYRGWFKGFQSLSWSPDSQSIFFVLFWERLGGRNNYARVFHFPSQEVFIVDEGLDAWYAGYNPV
jgi:WD40 repeat protein